MCDYSIDFGFNTRDAMVGDKLVSTKFTSLTRGFSAVGKPSVAVCVKPGTEIEFENNIKVKVKDYRYRSIIEDTIILFSKILRLNHKTIKTSTAIFRQAPTYINGDNSPLMRAHRADNYRHRDALEFPDGQVVLLTNLVPGQKAVVLQLPAEKIKVYPSATNEPNEVVYTGESCSNTTAPELETIS